MRGSLIAVAKPLVAPVPVSLSTQLTGCCETSGRCSLRSFGFVVVREECYPSHVAAQTCVLRFLVCHSSPLALCPFHGWMMNFVLAEYAVCGKEILCGGVANIFP